MHRLRALLPALAILAISTTVALAAGHGAVPSDEQPSVSPSADVSPSMEPSQNAEATESPEASEAPEATESPEAAGSPEAGHPVNHGCVVSLAAKTATPSGFKNHGQWVSSIAKQNHGHGFPDPTACVLPTMAPTTAPSASPMSSSSPAAP